MAETKKHKKCDKKCFFITPIGDSKTIARERMNTILGKVLKGALESLGYYCFRARGTQGALTLDIIKSIIESDLIVADITDQNPNVFYELAFALTIGKPTVMLQQKNRLYQNNQNMNSSSWKKLIANNTGAVIQRSEMVELLNLLQQQHLVDKNLVVSNNLQALIELVQSVQLIHLLQRKQKEVFNVKDAPTIYYEYSLAGKVLNLADTIKKVRVFAKVAKNRSQTDTLILQALRQQGTKKLIEILNSIMFLVNKGDIHNILDSLNGLFKASVNDLGVPQDSERKIYQYFEPEFFNVQNKLCEYAYKSPRFRLVKDFGAYCRDCTAMLERADPEDTGILTVQTPVDFKILSKFKKAYSDYIDATIKRIVADDEKDRMEYRRLVLLNHDTEAQVKKIESFLRKLILVAMQKKVKMLDHVTIGFVKLIKNDSIYRNLDFHITSTQEFSVAFLSSVQKGDFGQSIHVFDVKSDFSSRMKKDIDEIWKNNTNHKLDLPILNKPYKEIMRLIDENIKNIISNA